MVTRRRRRRRWTRALREKLDKALEAATNYKPNKADWLEGKWAGFTVAPGEEDRKGVTAVELEQLTAVGRAISEAPKNFDLNRKITRQLQEKRKTIDTGENIDWATGEALAFGTLLAEGTPVRLSGQDSGRGTFSQRHSVLVDQTNESEVHPAQPRGAESQARFEVIDSPLNEAGVLGFEYGYSSAEPNALVLWEAQFGDFANGAQVIIDQFICSGESKWLRMNGLVMLLPHGYEGQGPEHSSARLERYLQLSAEDNWQVVDADHAGQLLPRAAPPDAPLLPQAADRDDAEVAAAPQGLRLDAGRLRAGLVVPAHPGRRPTSSPTDAKVAPRRAVLGQGLLRSRGRAPQAQDRRHRHPAHRAALSVPVQPAGRAARRSIPMPRWCGARRSPRTWAPGTSSIAASSARWRALDVQGQAAGLYRPARGRVARDRLGAHASQGTGRSGRPRAHSRLSAGREGGFSHGRRDQGPGAG